MGKGDKKTKKGKRLGGNWGVHRPRTPKVKTSTAEELEAARASNPKKKETKKKVAEKAESKKTTSKVDDLKKIEGVGPKIAELLVNGGFDSYAKLAEADVEVLKEILAEAGSRYTMHDPTTWPEQSKMAAKGNWDELKKWQDELDGGKVK